MIKLTPRGRWKDPKVKLCYQPVTLGDKWDYTGLTTAQVQALPDSGKRYAQIRANLTPTGANPAINSVVVSGQTITDFTAVKGGSVDASTFKPGSFNYNEDGTGTGLDSFFVINSTNGLTDIVTNPGYCTIHSLNTSANTNDTFRIVNGPGVETDISLSGDFDVAMRFVGNFDSSKSRSVGLMVYTDDDNRAQIVLVSGGSYGNGVFRWMRRDSGANAGQGASGVMAASDVDGECALRLTRSSGVITAQYKNDTDATWQSLTGSWTYSGTVSFRACAGGFETDTSGFVAQINDLEILDGYASEAQCVVGDVASEENRHIDSGSGSSFDWSTFIPSITNCSVTWDISENNTGIFNSGVLVTRDFSSVHRGVAETRRTPKFTEDGVEMGLADNNLSSVYYPASSDWQLGGGTGDFTIMIDVTIPNDSDGKGPLWHGDTSSDGWRFSDLVVSSGVFRWFYQSPVSSAYNVDTPAGVTPGRHLFITTRDTSAGQFRTYADGVGGAVVNDGGETIITFPGRYLEIGHYPDVGTQFWMGIVHGVYISERNVVLDKITPYY